MESNYPHFFLITDCYLALSYMFFVYKNWLDVRRACLIEIFLKLPKTHSQNIDFKYLNALQFLIQRQKFVSSQFNNCKFFRSVLLETNQSLFKLGHGKTGINPLSTKKADDKLYVCKILKNILTKLIYIKNLKNRE